MLCRAKYRDTDRDIKIGEEIGICIYITYANIQHHTYHIYAGASAKDSLSATYTQVLPTDHNDRGYFIYVNIGCNDLYKNVYMTGILQRVDSRMEEY